MHCNRSPENLPGLRCNVHNPHWCQCDEIIEISSFIASLTTIQADYILTSNASIASSMFAQTFLSQSKSVAKELCAGMAAGEQASPCSHCLLPAQHQCPMLLQQVHMSAVQTWHCPPVLSRCQTGSGAGTRLHDPPPQHCRPAWPSCM